MSEAARESMRPVFVFLRCAAAGLVSAAVELALFWALWPKPAAAFARVASAGLNYWLVRRFAFRSRAPVAETLPRYAALAAASALLSFTAVRAFTLGLAWNAVVAKAVVDSLLFFANFAVERLLIFRSEKEGESIPGPMRQAMAVGLAGALLLWTAGAEVYGFISRKLFSQWVWMPWGLHRYAHFTGLFWAGSFVVLLFAPWGYAVAGTALVTAGTVVAIGPMPVVAVAFFLVASCALGWRILGRDGEQNVERDVIATLLGAAIYVFAFTLVARVPVNTWVTWGIALAAPIAADWRGVWARLLRWSALVRAIELRTWSERLAFGLLFFAIAVQWFGAIAPEASADGLAIHLAVPANIAAHHRFTYEPNNFVWSVMPLAADFAYTIVYLLGGEPAPSLLNFAMLLAIAALTYYGARRCVGRSVALLLTALLVATPLVQLVTGSLFVENFVAALGLGAIASFWIYRDAGETRLFVAAAMLGGAAIGAKLGMWAVALVAAPYVVAEARRRRIGRAGWVAAALLLAMAIPPYAIAYAKTGNPVFPFLNDTIPSKLLPHGVLVGNDGRFNEPLSWFTPFDLTFQTGDFFESQNGGMGFQWLLLIPLAALALFVARNRRATMAGAVALAAGGIIFVSKPNARYLYVVLPLFTIAFAGLLEWLAQRRRLRGALIAFAAVTAGLNLYFEAASSWYRKDFYSPLFFRPGGRAAYLKANAPLRYLLPEFRREHPRDHVLMVGETDLADAGDGGYEQLWHQYKVWRAIASSQRVTDLRRVFRRLDIRWISYQIPNEDSDLIEPPALREFLSGCTGPALQDGRFYILKIAARCQNESDADLESEIARMPPPIMAPGTYDDSHNGALFHGLWTHSRIFAGPYDHTVSYTDSPEALARFGFAGASLTYVHTTAPNRGIAELIVDGVPHEIDGYSADVHWQVKTEFADLGYGQHVVTLRMSGKKNPEAQGEFIDLDAFIAR